MPNSTPAASSHSIPTIKRRLISMVYESLLALAVLFLPFLLFELAVQGAHTPLTEHMRQCLAFLVMGAYFIHQWSHEGLAFEGRAAGTHSRAAAHRRLPLHTRLDVAAACAAGVVCAGLAALGRPVGAGYRHPGVVGHGPVHGQWAISARQDPGHADRATAE